MIPPNRIEQLNNFTDDLQRDTALSNLRALQALQQGIPSLMMGMEPMQTPILNMNEGGLVSLPVVHKFFGGGFNPFKPIKRAVKSIGKGISNIGKGVVKGLSGIFSNRLNLLNFNFIKMFLDILSFYNKSDKLKKVGENKTLGEYLNEQKVSKYFINYHIIPMVSAIWSMSPYKANQMPLAFFLKFFQKNFDSLSFLLLSLDQKVYPLLLYIFS